MDGMDAGRGGGPRPLRWVYVAVYGGVAIGGAALVALPARRFVWSLGLLHPVLATPRLVDALALLLGASLAALTLRFGLFVAANLRPRPGEHATFLALVGAAFALRAASGVPPPPGDPAAPLAAALGSLAVALDRAWAAAGDYAADPSALEAALAPLPPPGFVFRGRPLRWRVSLVRSPPAAGGDATPPLHPIDVPLPGDGPCTLYVSLSADAARAALTAVTLGPHDEPAILRRAGRPVVVRASGGTHGQAETDPLLPSYPGARPASSP